jgi:hypothetical protein
VSSILYQVDLTAQGNQTATANGAYTIDGLVWYAKGNLSQSGQTCTRNLVSGLGLSLIHTAGGGAITIGTNGDLDFPHWFLPLSHVPGYDPAIPHLIRAKFTWGVSGRGRGLIGVVDSTNDGTGLRAAVRTKDYFVGPELATAPATSSQIVTKIGTTGITSVNSRVAAVLNTSYAGTIITNAIPGWDSNGSESYASSGLPSDETTVKPEPASGQATQNYNAGSRSNPGICFAVNEQSVTTHSVYLTHLQVIRLGAAPAPVPDTTPPSLSAVSPAAGSTIGRSTTLGFQLTDASGWAIRELWIGFTPDGSDPDAYLLAHDGTEFRGAFAAMSSISAITDGYDIAIRRTGGWPSGYRVRLRASVVDAAGNVVVISA